MGVDVRVKDAIAIVEVSGVFSVETAETIARELAEHPEVGGRTGVLYDFSRLDENAIEPGELRKLARDPVPGSPRAEGPMAIVVACDLDFGMARMYTSAADDVAGRSRQVFRSRDEAWRWIAGRVVGGG